MRWNALTIRKPFCGPSEVAYLLDASLNQVERLWATGVLPQARDRGGRLFRPSGVNLVPALDLLPLLDAESAALFDEWQLDTLEIVSPGRKARRVTARSGVIPARAPSGGQRKTGR